MRAVAVQKGQPEVFPQNIKYKGQVKLTFSIIALHVSQKTQPHDKQLY